MPVFARTAVQETLQPSLTFCMVLESKETKVDQDPVRMFENDFAWIKVCAEFTNQSVILR
jgi:hypothetical protein